jgi:hypothetical protein
VTKVEGKVWLDKSPASVVAVCAVAGCGWRDVVMRPAAPALEAAAAAHVRLMHDDGRQAHDLERRAARRRR